MRKGVDRLNKNRYIICLLASGILLYYAVPRLSVTSTGTEGYFALAWLSFALMVIAGNLTGLLYTSSHKKKKQPISYKGKKGNKSRHYN
jgi:hypothetical protein